MRAAFLKGFLKVRVHATGNSLHAVHPSLAYMIYEVIDGTLALAVCEPQDMSALHVDDEGGVLVAVAQLKLVHAEKTSLLLRLYEGFAVHRVLVLEPLQINLFHRVFTKASQFGYLLVGKTVGQKIPCELKR